MVGATVCVDQYARVGDRPSTLANPYIHTTFGSIGEDGEFIPIVTVLEDNYIQGMKQATTVVN